jgi:hypothetical protein
VPAVERGSLESVTSSRLSHTAVPFSDQPELPASFPERAGEGELVVGEVF